jgi:hypothetical protein
MIPFSILSRAEMRLLPDVEVSRWLKLEPWAVTSLVAICRRCPTYSGLLAVPSYSNDLRYYFEWCAEVGLGVLEATRPHIEFYRAAMEEKGPAADFLLTSGVAVWSLFSVQLRSIR